ncbi:NHL repeat-containing protein [Aquimarina sp. MAR_2010_214]|uniref:NHL repeat-containing protein n=1 Tax=Aquimarina sp. MAR_2010_214 TaxID=1250026 RepID=UPI000C708F62|nr:NHL repeat-containing protein [Aquimarina sp. MAR_2010_214]PKV50334.1 NHL repeat-containing protein [Aquimarina sp. MAR_2010_214]
MKNLSKTLLLFVIGVVLIFTNCSKDDDATTSPPANKAPEIAAQSFNVSETAADADIFGTVKATDADKDELSYSITVNSDNLFEITKTGALSLVAGKTLDFETKTTHEITVEVTDGKAKAAAKVTITVIDEDENMPPVIAAQSFNIDENSASSTVIGTVVASDPDGDTLLFSIEFVNPSTSAFQISDTGEISIVAGSNIDYETHSSYTMKVVVSDNNLLAKADVQININDLNEIPRFPDRNYTFSKAEDIDDTVMIATVTATDPDGDTLIYTLNNNPGGLFEINSAGEISLTAGKSLDYETQTSHTVTVQATDGDLTALQHGVRINVTDVPETLTVTVSTFAGGSPGYADGIGTAARFGLPSRGAVDSHGNLFITDATNNRIRKITPAGVVTTFAGGSQGYADGTGSNAKFNYPYGVAIDASDNLYVVDYNNNRIRKITPAGVVTTFAGDSPGSANGTGTSAQFYLPRGIAIDTSGNLYVSDYGNNRIRKITPARVVTTLAGGNQGYADGTGFGAKFHLPSGIVVANNGDIYVSDSGNNRIRKVTPTGTVTTLAGNGTSGFADGTGTAAMFSSPRDITIDANNKLYVADFGNRRVREVTTSGAVTTIAGTGSTGSANGNGTTATFYSLVGITSAGSGVFYAMDQGNNRIRKVVATYTYP